MGIPRHLEKHLPWWLQHRSSAIINPLACIAIAAYAARQPVIATSILVLCLALDLSAFWVARAVLRAKGRWKRGTWYSEEMPAIQTARAVFFGILVVACGCTYLVVGAGIHHPALQLVAMVAWVLVIPGFIWTSLLLGSVSGDLWNVTYEDEQPGMFWGGMVFYSLLIALFVVVAIFYVFHPPGNAAG